MDLSTTRPASADDALITYRTLRIAMIAAAALLGVAVLLEAAARGAFETSISAYWYTPVRPVFVGSLVAMGIALITIRGANPWEEAFLNFAGVFTPVVALVPTLLPGEDNLTDPEVLAAVTNNMAALYVVGAAGIAVAALLRGRGPASRHPAAAVRVYGTAAVYVVGLALFAMARGFFTQRAHGISAVAMFLSMAVVVWIASRAEDVRAPWLRSAYAALSAVMTTTLLAVVALSIAGVGWTHLVLIAEAIEIAAFIAFWALQTWEHWFEEDPPAPSAAP